MLHKAQKHRLARSVKILEPIKEKVNTLIWAKENLGVQNLKELRKFFKNRYGRRYWRRALKGENLDSRIFGAKSTSQTVKDYTALDNSSEIPSKKLTKKQRKRK